MIKKTELQTEKEKELYNLLDSFEVLNHINIGSFLNILQYLNKEQLLEVYKSRNIISVLKYLCKLNHIESIFYVPFLKNAVIDQKNYADFLFIIKIIELNINEYAEIKQKENECLLFLKQKNKDAENNKQESIEEKIISSLEEIGFFSNQNIEIMLKNLEDLENIQKYIIDLFIEKSYLNSEMLKFSINDSEKYNEIIRNFIILNQKEKETVALALICKSINTISNFYLCYRNQMLSEDSNLMTKIIDTVLSNTIKAKNIKSYLNMVEFNEMCFYELENGLSEFNENMVGYARVLINNNIPMNKIKLFNDYIVDDFIFGYCSLNQQKIFTTLFDFKNRKVLSYLLKNERTVFFSLLNHHSKEIGLYDLNKKINNIETLTFSDYFYKKDLFQVLNFLYYFYLIGQVDFNNKYISESKDNVKLKLEENYRVLGIFNDDGYEILNVLFSRYEEKYGEIIDFNTIDESSLLETLKEIEVKFILDKGRIFSKSVVDIDRLLRNNSGCLIKLCRKINNYLELLIGNDYLYKYYKSPYSFGENYSSNKIILLNIIVAIRTGDFSLFKCFNGEKIKLDYSEALIDMIIKGADIENNKISDEKISVFSLAIKDYLEIISKIELIRCLNDLPKLNYYIDYLCSCINDESKNKGEFLSENLEYDSEFYHVWLDYYFNEK